MPRTNLCKRTVPHERVGRLIAGAAMVRRMSTADLAAKLGKCENTVRQRIRNPGDMTLSELTQLGKILGIPIDDLRFAIRY